MALAARAMAVQDTHAAEIRDVTAHQKDDNKPQAADDLQVTDRLRQISTHKDH